MSTAAQTFSATKSRHPRSSRLRRTAPSRSRAASTPAADPTVTSALFQTWRRQIACREQLADERGPRPFALIGFRIRGGSTAPSMKLVPFERLSFLAMFDERSDDDRMSTRLLGLRPSLGSEGIQIGGTELCLFDRDVRCAPAVGATGRRLDLADTALMETALGWERFLERVGSHPHYPRRSVLRWPTWWCTVAQVPSGVVVRDDHGRSLVPLDEALKQQLSILSVFADVTLVPKRQVVACAAPARSLLGQAGVTSFDLFHSRFR